MVWSILEERFRRRGNECGLDFRDYQEANEERVIEEEEARPVPLCHGCATHGCATGDLVTGQANKHPKKG